MPPEARPPEPDAYPREPAPGPPSRRRRIFRWVMLVVALIFFAFVFQRVLDPYGDAAYVEISHGNHVHYVPEDRDPDVPIGQFPMQPPGPGQRIAPDGRIVEAQ